MTKGILGGIFDFDGDGELDAFESAAELMFLDEQEKEELRANGLDLSELSLMDADEAREAIESAGLDPDDYDLD